jgi:hypothetical protein
MVAPHLVWCVLLTHLGISLQTSPQDHLNEGLRLGYTLLPMGQLDASSSYSTVVFKIPHLPPSNFSGAPSFCRLNLADYYGGEGQLELNPRQSQRMVEAAAQYSRLCDRYEALQVSFDTLSKIVHRETTDMQTDIDLLSPSRMTVSPRAANRQRRPRSTADNIRKFFGIAGHQTQQKLVDRVYQLQERYDNVARRIRNMTLVTELQTDLLDGLMSASRRHTATLNNHTRRITEIFTEYQDVSFQSQLNHGITMRLHTLTKQIIVTGMLQLTTLQHLLTLNTQRIIAVNSLLTNKLSPLLISPSDVKNALRRVQFHLYLKYPSYEVVHTDISYYYSRPHIVAWTSKSDIYVSLRVPITSAQESYNLYEIVTFPLASQSDSLSTVISLSTDILGYSAAQNSIITMSWDYYNRYCIKASFTRCSRMLVQMRHDPQSHCVSALYEYDVRAITKTCEVKAKIRTDNDQQVKLIKLDKRKLLILTTSTLTAQVQCQHDKSTVQIGPVTDIMLNCDCSLDFEKFRIPPLLTDDCAHMIVDYNITTYNISNMLVKSLYYNITNDEELLKLPNPKLNKPGEYIINNSHLNEDKLLDLRKMIELAKANDTALLYQPRWYTETHRSLSSTISRVWHYIFPILGVTASMATIVICLACKTSFLGKAVALLSTIPPSKAGGINLHTSLWIENCILAAIIVIATTWLAIRLYNFIKIKVNLSYIPLFNDKLSPRVTKIYLAIFSAHHTEYILIESICQQLEHLTIVERIDQAHFTLKRHCMSATLQIEWSDLIVEDKVTDMIWRLPSIVPISLFQYKRLINLVRDCHNYRLLTGSDNIYQSHAIMLRENKLVRVKQILRGTGPFRRVSI